MTDAELDEIKARCEAASPGPWTSWVEGRDHTSGSSVIITGTGEIEAVGMTVADQDFIAHSRQDVARLLDEVARLRDFGTPNEAFYRRLRSLNRNKDRV